MNETYDVSAFRAVFERSFTWISGFLRNVRRFGEKTAVIDPASGRTWTYDALNLAEPESFAHVHFKR